MENYLITNKTIAILKNNRKIYIYDVDKVVVINNNIKNFLEYNCNYYGFNYDGRKKSAQNILRIKYRVPLIINEEQNITLIQLNSLRNKDCLFLVTSKIIDYEYFNKNLKIICSKNLIFYSKISKNSFEKLLINSLRLNNILNWRKSANFL